MARNLRSAKQAGSSFERLIADYLRDNYHPSIDRMVKKGANDEGDIAGVTFMDGRYKMAVECKSPGKNRGYAWPQYVREAEAEADNLGAPVGVVVAKRHGTNQGGDQWCMMTVDMLITLLKCTNTQDPQTLEGDSMEKAVADAEDALKRISLLMNDDK